ncbi:MAG: HlyD family efflux transporter periplasmic adaptor subunit [Chloroflexota bacterium]|nr:MAG: HlyD family efflux transporter periplasmic adaptor subunit [Chloroflexota bacterium]
MKNLIINLTLITLALLTAACTAVNAATPEAELTGTAEITPRVVTAEGKLLPEGSVELAFAQGGVVDEIYVNPGDTLAAGEVIARIIGSQTVEAELAAARLEQLLAGQSIDSLNRSALLNCTRAEQALREAQKAYESQAARWYIRNLDHASELELNIDDYISAEKDYRLARDLLNSLLDKDQADRERKDAQDDFTHEQQYLSQAYAELLQSLAENDQPLSQEQNNLLAAIANLEIARELQSRLDGHNLDPEQLNAAETRLSAASAHVEAAQAALELYELRAPFSGILFSLDLITGETALPGVPVAFIANDSRWIVETKDLAEIDIARIVIGQRAMIKLDAFPDEEFTGAVVEIDPIGKEYLGDMTYPVTIALDDADTRFLWNMTATVTIVVE